jgi:hypothetical protein
MDVSGAGSVVENVCPQLVDGGAVEDPQNVFLLHENEKISVVSEIESIAGGLISYAKSAGELVNRMCACSKKPTGDCVEYRLRSGHPSGRYSAKDFANDTIDALEQVFLWFAAYPPPIALPLVKTVCNGIVVRILKTFSHLFSSHGESLMELEKLSKCGRLEIFQDFITFAKENYGTSFVEFKKWHSKYVPALVFHERDGESQISH